MKDKLCNKTQLNVTRVGKAAVALIGAVALPTPSHASLPVGWFAVS